MSEVGDELYEPGTLPERRDDEDAPKGPKNLLDLDPREAAKALLKLWEDQNPIMQPREAKWEVNALRRAGHVNVRLVRHPDTARFTVYPPADRRAWPRVELFNKARVLCRTFTGNMLADPPAPFLEPTSDTDEDRDAAELSIRALEDLQGKGRLNTQTKLRKAVDRACTFGSGFIRYWIDPMGGGRQAKKMLAAPQAQTADSPFIDPMTGGPFTDPEALDEMGQPLPVEPVERFVLPTQGEEPAGLTDTEADADHPWKPDLRSEVLSGRHVRFIPHTADGIDDAHGVLLASYITVGQAKQMYPEVADMSPEQIDKLTKFKPSNTDHLLPKGVRRSDLKGDEALIFHLTGVWTECGDYPDGAYVCALGGEHAPYREKWVATVAGKREVLPLPVSQVRLFDNGEDDPYAEGLMDDLGGANELRAAQIGHLMAHLDTINAMPKIGIPSTSTMTEGDLFGGRRMARFLPGHKPEVFQLPDFDAAALQVFELAGTEMDGASHLQQAAQGVEDSSVNSGRHAYQIIAQVHAQLSEPKQNIEEAYVRCCDIELRLARAFGIDGETRWQGEDGDYKYRRWEASDLGGDVRIKPGTMTMLSPAAKAQLVKEFMGMGVLDPIRAQDMLANGVGTVLGRWDDPWKQEIKRSLALWEEGPPEGYMGPPPPVPMQGVGPDGQPMAQLVPQPDPVAESIFVPAPHHTMPMVALMRVQEIARVMASKKYQQFPPIWRMVLDAEFQKASMAAQPPAPVDPNAPDDGGEPTQAPPAGMPPLDPPQAA